MTSINSTSTTISQRFIRSINDKDFLQFFSEQRLCIKYEREGTITALQMTEPVPNVATRRNRRTRRGQHRSVTTGVDHTKRTRTPSSVYWLQTWSAVGRSRYASDDSKKSTNTLE
ncbi:hypothetical protein CBL_07248 [Carabus blaptoides fortunei]